MSVHIIVSVLVDPAIITNKLKLYVGMSKPQRSKPFFTLSSLRSRGRRAPRSRHLLFSAAHPYKQVLLASNATHQLFQLTPGLVLARWHDHVFFTIVTNGSVYFCLSGVYRELVKLMLLQYWYNPAM
jgi:hypothetical protein